MSNKSHSKYSPLNNPLPFAICISLIITALLYQFISVALPETSPTPTPPPFVSYIHQDNSISQQLLHEQSLLLDSQSIFLPSKWSQPSSAPASSSPNSLFNDFPEQISLSSNTQSLQDTLTPSPSPNQQPSSLLNYNSAPHFDLFARKSFSPQPLPSRIARISIQNLNNPKHTIKTSIPISDSFPKTTTLWKPSQYLFLIDNSSLPPEPFTLKPSGSEPVDQFFKNILHNSPIIKALPQGYYLISFSP